jgi:hypothetical protein
MIILFDDGIVSFLSDQDVLGAESLLTKYIYQLCNHITETLPVASSLAATSNKHFSLVVSILKGDVIGMFFFECHSFENFCIIIQLVLRNSLPCFLSILACNGIDVHETVFQINRKEITLE